MPSISGAWSVRWLSCRASSTASTTSERAPKASRSATGVPPSVVSRVASAARIASERSCQRSWRARNWPCARSRAQSASSRPCSATGMERKSSSRTGLRGCFCADKSTARPKSRAVRSGKELSKVRECFSILVNAWPVWCRIGLKLTLICGTKKAAAGCFGTGFAASLGDWACTGINPLTTGEMMPNNDQSARGQDFLEPAMRRQAFLGQAHLFARMQVQCGADGEIPAGVEPDLGDLVQRDGAVEPAGKPAEPGGVQIEPRAAVAQDLEQERQCRQGEKRDQPPGGIKQHHRRNQPRPDRRQQGQIARAAGVADITERFGHRWVTFRR
ncbi:hypothetical protein SPO2844 [Ruegeria pomeroyi DSS-3]|uniref:Uncharacterized protein n=1 Tax=Ruegeria pomeroyi (strain ATCC 700808 / DSM 15171 / DSS-3) TaxID=246200 RepID=Q5LPK4_RUEPO|nr:hypothetical protein SPO2844 [Ruegeria pomeroyi DSS-3]